MPSTCSPNLAGSPVRWPGSAPCWHASLGWRSGTVRHRLPPPMAASRRSTLGARRTWRRVGWTGSMVARSSPPWHDGSVTVSGVPGGGRATGRAGTGGERAGAHMACKLAGGQRGVRPRTARPCSHTCPGAADGPDGTKGPSGLRRAASLVLRQMPSSGAGVGPRRDAAPRGQAGRVAAVHEVPQAILVR